MHPCQGTEKYGISIVLGQQQHVSISSDQVYSYLDGRIKHFKHIGGTHGDTLGNAQIKNEIKMAISGGF